MLLIYIENKDLLSKIINYLDHTSIKYTTNLKDNYDYILLAEISKKTIELSYEKKIIFITYLIENKIYLNYNSKNKKNNIYKNNLNNFFNKCFQIITSNNYIKEMINKNFNKNTVTIEHILPDVKISKNIYNKYKLNKRKKILLIDINYQHIKDLYLLCYLYPKYDFIYIGYKPSYLMKKKDIENLNNLPNNVIYIKYYDLNIYSDLCKISELVINYEDINLDIKYLYTILLLKKQLLIKESRYFDNFLLDNKNCYFFKDNKELILKIKKIFNNRITNLTSESYELIKNNTFDEIVKKFNKYLNVK
ncbi:MAG: hypothetical protein PHN42_02475 [Bacilli bacterium]|nr:hypothetical protein [Bacilli bacterium]